MVAPARSAMRDIGYTSCLANDVISWSVKNVDSTEYEHRVLLVEESKAYELEQSWNGRLVS